MLGCLFSASSCLGPPLGRLEQVGVTPRAGTESSRTAVSNIVATWLFTCSFKLFSIK